MVTKIIEVKWEGLTETKDYFIRLPSKLQGAAKQSMLAVAKFLQRSAKLRAQRGWTGNLANSIVVEPAGKDRLQVVVGARYGFFVEHGMHPAVIPIEYVEQHLTAPGSIGIDTRTFGASPRSWLFPGPAKPFWGPAVAATQQQIPMILDRALARAIK